MALMFKPPILKLVHDSVFSRKYQPLIDFFRNYPAQDIDSVFHFSSFYELNPSDCALHNFTPNQAYDRIGVSCFCRYKEYLEGCSEHPFDVWFKEYLETVKTDILSPKLEEWV